MTIEAQEQKSSAEMIDSNVNDQLKTVDANAIDFATTELPENKLQKTEVTNFLTGIQLNGKKLNISSVNVDTETINLDSAITNILKDIFPNKTEIKMEDIYGLSDTQKADLTWKVIAIQPLNAQEQSMKMKSVSGGLIDYGSIQTALLYGIKIGTTTNLPQNDTYKTRGVQLDTSAFSIAREDFEQYSSLIANNKNAMFKDLFVSFYRKGDKMPSIIPSTYALATGDLQTSTTGIGGIGNLGRESFSYDFDTKNTQTNSLRFGPAKESMSIVVGAEGIDKIGGEINFMLTDLSGKEYTINGVYGSEGLSFTKSSDLKGVTINDNVITFSKEYKGRDIQVNTKSNQYANGSYDEIVFPISTDGILGMVKSKTNYLTNDNNYKLGDYKLTDEQIISLHETVQDIGYYGSRITGETLPITLYAGVNDVSIPESDINSKFLQNPELFTDNSYTVIKNTIQKPSVKKIRSDYQTKIDNMSSADMGNTQWSGNQLQAQKLLTKLRFLTALEEIDNDPKVTKLLEAGKLDISLDYKKEKASGMAIKPFDYVEKK